MRPAAWARSGRDGAVAEAQSTSSRTTASASNRPRSVSTARPSLVRPRLQQPLAPAPGAAPRAPSGRSRDSGTPPAAAAPAGSAPPAGPPPERTSRPAPGDRPAASAAAYAPGCFTFHHRTPPTWLCAPGPAPHQSAPRQYSSLCRQRPASGGGPVGHLVPVEPGRRQHLVGDQIAVGVHVVVGHRHLAAPDAPGQLRALLDDQRVRRDVVGPGADRRRPARRASRRRARRACRRSGRG